VQGLCEKYGVEYKTDTWGRTLKRALSYIGQLGQKGGVREVVRSMA
jgi:linoleoyl-CoA desaturase